MDNVVQAKRDGGGHGEVPALSILLPVRNETDNLRITLRLLPALLDFPYEIIVVHDDAEDTSIPVAMEAQARNPNIRIVQNQIGRGAINAVRAGVAEARAKYVLIFASDEIGPIFIIDDMLALMNEGCDLVSCTRYAHGGRRLGGSMLPRALSTVANRLFGLLAGSRFTDLTTGIKMFSREKFPELGLESRPIGWAFAFEMALKAEHCGWRLGEVPMVSIDRLFGGASSFTLGPWIQEYLRWFLWGLTNLSRRGSNAVKVRLPVYWRA